MATEPLETERVELRQNVGEENQRRSIVDRVRNLGPKAQILLGLGVGFAFGFLVVIIVGAFASSMALSVLGLSFRHESHRICESRFFKKPHQGVGQVHLVALHHRSRNDRRWEDHRGLT